LSEMGVSISHESLPAMKAFFATDQLRDAG